jgi:ATP-binding cassette subfamily F protein 3
MVGYLPQESEPVGEETVMDVATGRAGEVQALEKQLHALEQAGDVSSAEYLEAHAKHEALSNPQVGREGEEDAARARLSRGRFRPQGKGDERRLGDARASRAFASDGAGSALLDEPTNHLDLLSLCGCRIT